MIPTALFYVIAVGAVATALGMVLSRNVVHAVLFMVANFGLTAILYVMLRAPFIAVVQVVVYAGAIMVLFLFVVMLLGRREAALDEPLARQRPLGALLLVVLLALLVSVVSGGIPAAPATDPATAEALDAGFGSPAAIGDALFRWHVLPFEIVSLLLLVAMIGAVVIARFRGDDGDTDGARDATDGGGA